MSFAAKPPNATDAVAPFHPQIPDLKDIINGELAQSGAWIVANIFTNSFWPITSQKVRWRGVDIWIIPITRRFYPAIALMIPKGKSRVDCEEIVMRFLSMLSWVQETGFMVEGGGLSGGNLPRPLGRDQERGLAICDEFDLSYFPEVSNEKALLALGLMREGRGLNHVGYAFLSFYRVLEVAFANDKQRIAWISATLPNLDDFGVKDALHRIKEQGVNDIGRHLYESGRCAMAHANRKPIVDPDNLADARRLGSELPIVRALAARAIEEVFGVDSRGSNFHKHLYELGGFKEILGPVIVTHIQNGTAPPESTLLNIPDISVRISRKNHYSPLERLRCVQVGYSGKQVQMLFQSLQKDVAFRFSLDFSAERIQFDLFHDILVLDTGSVEAAERMHEVRRFWQDYFGNGKLHIVNAATDELIGRKDAYIPVNMYLDGEAAAAELAYWKALAQQRRERDQMFANEMERNEYGYDIKITLGR